MLSIQRSSNVANKPWQCKSLPLAAQRMVPSGKPGQDCQGEQALASARTIRFTSNLWV